MTNKTDHRRQEVQQIVKNACDQLNQEGVDARNYVEQLAWLFFLKAFDEAESRREEEASTTHSFLHIIARCEHVTEENIGVVTYTSTSHPWGPKGLPSGTQLGGMSGGAVYLVEEDPLTKIFLVGTIYEYQPGLEIMLARPFTLINPDGSIRD